MIGVAILFYIVVLFVIAPTIVLTMTRRLYRPIWQMHSASASNATLPVRSVEAAMVAALSGLVFIFWMTYPGTSVCVFNFKRMPAEVASVHMILIMTVGALLLISDAAAWWWRTWLGVTVATATLLGYMYLLSGMGMPFEQRFGVGMQPPPIQLSIKLQNDIEGAELWVNDVYLGKTPVRMTLKEFYAKVPSWSKAPVADSNSSSVVRVPAVDVHGNKLERRRKWISFGVRRVSMKTERGHWRIDYGSGFPNRDYYARVKLDGEWAGGFGGAAGFGGGGDGWAQYSGEATLHAHFPERNRRLKKLLNQARALDYTVSDAWFSAMQKFGMQGREVLQRVVTREPGFQRVMDDWATHKFDLKKVTDAPSVWEALIRICHEADRNRRYSTAGIEGSALELLINYLDAQQVVEYALTRIRV